VTKVFDDFMDGLKKGKKVHVFEGGARSSKTYSIMQMLILLCIASTSRMDDDLKFLTSVFSHKPPFRFSIARARLTWTKATVLKDFNDITHLIGIPFTPEFNPNRAEQIYFINGTEFDFIGLDEPMKLHGRAQDLTWINEAMETNWNDVQQLLIRTGGLKIFDYNPSALNHWVYDKVATREDAITYYSTMLDNDFIDKGVKEEILRLEPTAANIQQGTADITAWKIYGLGQRAALKGLIITNWEITKEFPAECRWVVHGLDFGFTNDPTTCIKIGLSEGVLYVDELFYKTAMTNADIDQALQNSKVTYYQELFADSADPKSIEELRRHGWNIKGAAKGPDSVNAGIDIIKRYKIFVTERSLNVIRELKNYKWKEDKNGDMINIPVDNFNHAMDALRYAVTSKITQQQPHHMLYVPARSNHI